MYSAKPPPSWELAAYALLYVVGEHVPRVDFLTTVDRFIFATLGCLL